MKSTVERLGLSIALPVAPYMRSMFGSGAHRTTMIVSTIATRARVALVALLGCLSCSAANAVTLTFDSFAHDEEVRLSGPYTGDFYAAQSFVDQGYTVRIQPSPWIIWGRDNSNNADPGGATLTNLDGRAAVSFERANASPFMLNSIDIASAGDRRGPGRGRLGP